MDGAKPSATPMTFSSKWSQRSGDPLSDPTEYRSIVGALQYCTLTQPKINFVVNKLYVKSKDDCNQATNRCKPKVREQGSSQRSETQINWISPELLETIESIPYHEHFIHMHDGSLPRG